MAEADAKADGGEKRTNVGSGHDSGSAVRKGGPTEEWKFQTILAIALISEKNDHGSAGAQFLLQCFGRGAPVQHRSAAVGSQTAHKRIQPGLANAAISGEVTELWIAPGGGGKKFETAKVSRGQQNIARTQRDGAGFRTGLGHVDETRHLVF